MIPNNTKPDDIVIRIISQVSISLISDVNDKVFLA